MCQLITTRQLRRSTLCPLRAADSSAKLHWVGSACRPAVDMEPMDSTPQPYLPARVMPDGLTMEATAMGTSSCTGRSCSAASRRVNQSLS